MLVDFIQYFETGKHSMESAIAQAIPGVFNNAFMMISSGDINQVIAGLLILLGITLMLCRGVWKIVAKTLLRQIVSS